jgi:PEP-CTERM motif-containing protein
MKKVLLPFFLFGAILSASTLSVQSADPIVRVAAEDGAPAGPYLLNFDGNSIVGMCMDDFRGADGTWTVNVTSLANPNLGNTMLGNSSDVFGYQFTSTQMYSMEAYLFQEINKPGADRAGIQLAAWALMDPTTLNGVVGSNNTTVENYLYAAYDNLSTIDAGAFEILTDVNGTHQEFMTSTPEPGSMALLGAGLFAVGAAQFLRRKKLVVATN